MADEYTTHTIFMFLVADGDHDARIATAMHHMLLPILHGTNSTVLGILLMALSPFPFIRDTYFWPFFCVITAGVTTGVLFVPVLLVVAGPDAPDAPPADKPAVKAADAEALVPCKAVVVPLPEAADVEALVPREAVVGPEPEVRTPRGTETAAPTAP